MGGADTRTDHAPAARSRAEPCARTNIVADRVALVGRGRDLAALEAWHAGGAPLLTVVGPGGVGKTRLASCFAQRRLAAYARAGGAWFCDLSAAASQSDVVAAVARVLGVRTVGRDALEGLGRALASRGATLLVLDNCEQAVAHVRAAAASWSRRAPGVRFLATSREALGVDGEVRHDLAPLDATDAVALFEARAQLVRPGWSPRGPELDEVARLVQQLDGLPLAVELAAARMEVLSPGQILARMARRFELLRRESPGTAPRHAALEAAVAWSWDLLSAFERAALAQCAVFRGGFTLEAAEAVVRLGPAAPSVLDVVQSLRHRSLVHLAVEAAPGRELRLTVYESIREFAAARLESSGERAAAERRHAAYYTALAERLSAEEYGPDEEPAFARLAVELDNALAAHRRERERDPATAVRIALALDAMLIARGASAHVTELVEACSAAVERAGDPTLLARSRYVAGKSAWLAGRGADAAQLLGEAVALAQRHGLREVECGCLRALSYLASHEGHADDAESRARRAVEVARAAGHRALEAVALSTLGDAATFDGRVALARASYAQALAIHRAGGNARWESDTLNALGAVEAEAGCLDEARDHLEAALALQRAAGNRRLEGVALTYLGSARIETGPASEAAALLRTALAIHREVDRPLLAGTTLNLLGHLQHRMGDADAAQQSLSEAAELADQLGDAGLQMLTRAALGALAADRGRAELARAAFSAARAHREGLGHAAFVSALDVLEGFTDVARLRDALARGDRAGASLARDAARARIEHARAPRPSPRPGADPLPAATECSADPRLAVGLLEQALAPVADDADPAAAAPALAVHEDGDWFQPAGGARVRCARNAARALLARLATARVAEPGAVVPWEALVAAAWPGDRSDVGAQKNRLRVSLALLRRLGLGDLLQTRDGGYRFDPDAAVGFAHWPGTASARPARPAVEAPAAPRGGRRPGSR